MLGTDLFIFNQLLHSVKFIYVYERFDKRVIQEHYSDTEALKYAV